MASSAKPPKKLGVAVDEPDEEAPGGRAWAWRTRWGCAARGGELLAVLTMGGGTALDEPGLRAESTGEGHRGELVGDDDIGAAEQVPAATGQ